MIFFPVRDPRLAFLLLVLAGGALFGLFVFAHRLIRLAEQERLWDMARRELDPETAAPFEIWSLRGTDWSVLLAKVRTDDPAIRAGLADLSRLEPDKVRALAGRFRGARVALLLADLGPVRSRAGRIVVLPESGAPVIGAIGGRAFPPRNLARRLEDLVARAQGVSPL